VGGCVSGTQPAELLRTLRVVAIKSRENQLTRALVVVLKLSPMAYVAWLRRVDPRLRLHELAKVDWRAQRRDIVPAASTDVDGLRVFSVFVSGERADAGGQVEQSERGQVLDAIALYGTEPAIVVEEKVTAGPDDRVQRPGQREAGKCGAMRVNHVRGRRGVAILRVVRAGQSSRPS